MKKKRNIDLLLTTLIIILAIVLFFINYEKDCKSDEICFSDAAKTCKQAKLSLENNNQIFTYEIQGAKDYSCIIKVKAFSINGKQETISNFEGKDMICIIPKSNLTEHKISDLEIIDYCSGPLKEAMYELVIERLYGSIAQNLGHILLEINKEV